MRRIIIFEDGESDRLAPLSLLRPAPFIRLASRTLAERTAGIFKVSPEVMVRDGMGEIPPPPGHRIVSRVEEDALFLNGRAIFKGPIPSEGGDEVGVSGGKVVYLRLSAERAASFDASDPMRSAGGLPIRRMNLLFLENPWEIIGRLERSLAEDLLEIKGREYEGGRPRGVFISGDAIRIGKGARVGYGSALDSTAGPILIGEGAEVGPLAVIKGPTIIGPGAIVHPHSLIRGSAVGEGSRVGGEVSASVLFPYMNKQHDGFLGHAVVGSWVNLGAGTTASNLKNNYGEIRVSRNGKSIATGLMYLGPIIGDHSKTGIQVSLNTGTIIGIGCNIYGTGLMPKDIPDFSWGGSDGFVKHDIEKCIETARTVMARRGFELSSAEEAALGRAHAAALK